jgi:hypothetical protein
MAEYQLEGFNFNRYTLTAEHANSIYAGFAQIFRYGEQLVKNKNSAGSQAQVNASPMINQAHRTPEALYKNTGNTIGGQFMFSSPQPQSNLDSKVKNNALSPQSMQQSRQQAQMRQHMMLSSIQQQLMHSGKPSHTSSPAQTPAQPLDLFPDIPRSVSNSSLATPLVTEESLNFLASSPTDQREHPLKRLSSHGMIFPNDK